MFLHLARFIAISFLLLISANAFAGPRVVAGEYIVKYKGSPAAAAVYGKIQGKANLKASISMGGMYHIAMKPGQEAAIEDIKNDPEVEFVEPNYIMGKHTEENPGVIVQTFSASEISALATPGTYTQTGSPIKATEAWAASSAYSASNRPIVAVVDTGLDSSHTIFAQSGALWVNTREIANNGIDDDFNGYIDDVNGWSFVSNSKNFYDDEGHGTHVSGIVLGATQDILAPTLQPAKVQIMPLKFLDSTGSGTTSAAISAIYYAVNNGARVINCSWGGSSYSQALHQALAFAYNHDVLIVSAAGNYTQNNDVVDMYPANYDVPSNLSVAATSDYDALASFSNYGLKMVHVGAPGVMVYSSVPGNYFGLMSGTSMAAPFASGLAALTWREAPQLSSYQMRSLLMSTVDPINVLAGKVSTGGRLNSLNSINQAKSSVGVMTSLPVYNPAYKASRSTASVTSSSSGGGGCGMVSAIGGAAGSSGMGGGSSTPFMIGLLLLPLFYYIYLQMKVAQPRRRFDRFRMQSEVRLMAGDRELVGQLRTISLGGASFSIDEALEKGGVIKMQIQSPNGKEQIEVEGHIVWSEQNQAYGVQFDQARDGVLSMISGWTRSLVKMN